MENWWMRALAKGIVQSTDLVPVGMDGGAVQLLHHPTGEMRPRQPDWIVLAVPAQPADALYHDLKQRGVNVVRVGDCIAPRRAHAAVVDGERVGAAL
jgi:2,4-dienoyl-CoA reductase (NADPH2)